MKGSWLTNYAKSAGRTDQLASADDYISLLAAGLMGETGSILAELKKEQRERDSYPAYRRKMAEEIGDFLWYFVRLVSLLDPNLLQELDVSSPGRSSTASPRSPQLFLDLGFEVGEVLAGVRRGISPSDARSILRRVWDTLRAVAEQAEVVLRDAALENIHKIESRWPKDRTYSALFDEDFPEEEQLPRKLDVEFREKERGEQKIVILRCNGINFGDRLTDNILDPDGYRYHDIFHFAHAVHLGWSPIVRAVLRCKRKSIPKIDEAEDGARAGILEEAVAAIVFSRAKQLGFFQGLDHVDYDLLKIVQELTAGYEVDRIPMWQWEVAILDGYRMFRELRDNGGGHVSLNIQNHRISYLPPKYLA